MRFDFGALARIFCLAVFGFQIRERFHVDGDNFENGSRVGAYIFHADKKKRFQKYMDKRGRGLS